MDDLHIDGATASIITDRAKPPEGLGVAPYTIKAVLWCLRGLGAPGASLNVPRGIIEERTCLKETAVKRAIKALVSESILIRVLSPAPGRYAQYRLDYMKLAEWLDGPDRQVVRLDSIQNNAGASRPRTQAQRAPERRRDAPASKSTQALSAPTQARSARTQARRAPDLKEETALPALPAAAAPDLAVQLANAAVAGVGIMTGEAWEAIAKKAGLDRDLAALAAHTLTDLGIQIAENGRRALERLAERLSSTRKPDNPIGLLRTIATQSGGPEPTTASLKRDRNADRKREQIREQLHTFEPEQLDRLTAKTRVVVERRAGHAVATKFVPDARYLANAPDVLIDFMLAHRDEIVKVDLKGAAA